MGLYLLNDSVIILSDLFAAFKALLEIFLPRGFENLHVTLFPSLELLQRDAKLRWLRYQKGLRQRDVADYAGIDRSTYVHYEEYGKDLSLLMILHLQH